MWNRNHIKGFTLVEVIVVLVIILATISIPALTGYIENAKEKKALAEGHHVVVATQSILSEKYATNQMAEIEFLQDSLKKESLALAKVKGSFLGEIDYLKGSSAITNLVYLTGNFAVIYDIIHTPKLYINSGITNIISFISNANA